MDLDLINVITYVCAALGGVLLLLCIILAAFFVYSACKKHFCPGSLSAEYVIVPTEQNGQHGAQQIVLRKFSNEGKWTKKNAKILIKSHSKSHN